MATMGRHWGPSIYAPKQTVLVMLSFEILTLHPEILSSLAPDRASFLEAPNASNSDLLDS